MHNPRKSKRPGPLPHQQRLHRAQDQRRTDAQRRLSAVRASYESSAARVARAWSASPGWMTRSLQCKPPAQPLGEANFERTPRSFRSALRTAFFELVKALRRGRP